MHRLLIRFAVAGMLGHAAICHSQVVLKPKGDSGVKLRLKGLKAEVVIDRQIAVTKLDLLFQNPADQRIEADYVYALLPDTVVTWFAYYYKEEQVVARVAEKERAAAIYKHITSRMRDPALIEMTGKRTFRARIFPIEPNADLRVEMTFVQALPNRGFAHTYALPTQQPKGQSLENIDVSVKIKASEAEWLVSNNFGLPAAAEGDERVISFSGKNMRPEKDLRVQIAKRNPSHLVANLYAARSGGTDGFFLLALTPPKATSGPVSLQGIKTYVVLTTSGKAAPGATRFVAGRYYGTGEATVKWGNHSAKINFEDRVEPNHPAMKIWAARKIERLGTSEKVRKQVIALSSRHTIPSHFTSWIAIPKEERERYKREQAMADLELLAKRYVDSLSKDLSETATSRAIKTKMQPLAKVAGYRVEDALRNQLWELQYEAGVEAGKEFLLGKRGPNTIRLERISALTGGGQDLADYYARSISYSLGHELAAEVESGRSSGPRAQSLRKMLTKAQSLGYVPKTAARDAIEQRMYEVSYDIETRVRAKKNPKSAELKALANLSRASKIDAAAVRRRARADVIGEEVGEARRRLSHAIASGSKTDLQPIRARIKSLMEELPARHHARAAYAPWEASSLAHEYAREVAKGNRESDAQKSRLEKIEALGREFAFDPKAFVSQQLKQQASSIANSLWWEEQRSRLNEAEILRLQNQIERLNVAGAGFDYSAFINAYQAWPEYQARLELLKELRKPNPDRSRVEHLNKRLAEVSGPRSVFGNVPKDWTPEKRVQEYPKARLERLETDVLLDKLEKETPSPAVEARRAELEKKAEELRARMGDPLITIEAPADSQSVVALFPDGESKPLVYRPERSRWEVRFDVPTHAKEGTYSVQVIVVDSEGKRTVHKTDYHVDLTPPRATATLKKIGDLWLLEVRGSEDIARVEAFSPSDEPTSLLRQPTTGTFRAFLENVSGGLRVVVTDRAHNRTELWVEPSR